MFSSYSKCTEALLNITLSLYSSETYAVVPPCNTWQDVLENTLNYTSTQGTFMDVVSSGSFAAVPPPSIAEDSAATSIDGLLFAFVYLTAFVAYSDCINKLA